MRAARGLRAQVGRLGVRGARLRQGGRHAPRARTVELTLSTDLRIGFEGGRARARTTLRDGDTAFVALSWSDHGGPETYDDAYHRLVFTADYWHEWLSHGEFPDHPWRTYLQRSALTLKGLTYAPTGAMIAAATTSLPETPGGERNWDYRYAWIRDSTFMLWGLYTLGFDEEANDFFYFIRDVASETDDELQIMYGIGGEETLTEEMLLHLDGYEHAQPVRVGNGAYAQKQHDVWGALLDSIYLHTKSRDGLAESTWEILCKQVDHAIAAWREPDRGIWEVRGEPQHFTSSKVMCWVACDRGARLARLREDHERGERWQAAADEIHADICEHGIDERGVFCQHYDTAALDASCLLIPLVRFLPPDDERVIATVNAIADELTLNGLVQRYKVEETDDGLAGEEGTFAICSFWLVSALAEIGEHDRARALCEKMLGFASGLNLYAEEIDARSGRHLGNFPQAFTHLALINAVMHVIRADHDLAASQPLLESRREEIITPMSATPSSPAAPTAEAVAARVAEVMAAAIDGARTIHGAAHVALSGGSLARAYELVGPQLPDWRDVHLWYGDERCVALDDEESNHRLATEHLDAPDATWHPVPTQLGCDEAAAAYAQEIADVTLDIAVNGMGPDGHTASLFPGFPQVHADGVCVAVHGSPKPPPDRVTLTLAKLNAVAPDPARRRGCRQGAAARARDRGPGPRGTRLAAGPRAPGDRRRRGGPRWLTRSGCCATPRPSGRGRASTPGAPTSRSPTRAARWRARCARAWRATPSPSCSARRSRAPARRRSSRASSLRPCATTSWSGTTASTRA